MDLNFVPDEIVKKLIVLYIFDKMDIVLTEKSIIDICSNENGWIEYMECVDILENLKKTNFIIEPEGLKTFTDEKWYKLTVTGKETIGMLYYKIPESLRSEIDKFAAGNKLIYKRNQEYKGNYYKNKDGSYTIELRILEPVTGEIIFEISIIADTRNNAITACRRWREMAASIYELVYEKIIED